MAVLSIAMSGSTLFSHYCGGHLKKAAINTEVDPCHQLKAEVVLPSCHAPTPSCHASNDAPAEDDCCRDEATWQQTDEYVMQVDAFDFQATSVVLFFQVALPDWELPALGEILQPITSWKPPIPPPIDRQVSLQTFLL